jgi:tRNA pseudouridine32 synthase/23S rRNA pseudouridine746 synthase/23S rRNA pseudouridine1911/1915/1917 synthase
MAQASSASEILPRRVFVGPARDVARSEITPDLRKMPATTSDPARTLPAALVERVLYRDGLVLVIDKPAGVPVHAGPGGGPNLEHWFPLLRFGLPRPPALAHRLDRDTSGCLVLGRHKKALRRLGQLFAEGRIEKTYWAVLAGVPAEPEGRIEAALAKQTRGKVGWRMVLDPEGQPAITDYRVLGAANGRAWVELRPRTGRTHQIRVHCAALGCPVEGDPLYGGPADLPMQLHARAIAVPLYPGKAPISVCAPVPPHMRPVLAALGYREPDASPVRSAVA